MKARDDVSLVLDHVRKMLAGQESVRLTDRELLQRFARNRDAEAFAALVQRHGRMILNVCRRLLQTSQDVEDAFQATFLILVRKSGTQRWQESVGTWLHLVAYRVALRLRTAQQRTAPLDARSHASPAADPLAEVSGRELSNVLDQELSRLPEKYRAPLVLCCLEGRTRDEAAQQCGLSLDQLKRRLAKGRVLLRQRLGRRGFTPAPILAATLCAEKSTAGALSGQMVWGVVSAASRAATSVGLADAFVPPRVLWLAELPLRGTMLVRLQAALALALLLCALGFGAGLTLLRTRDENHAATQAVPGLSVR
jgi:RNA polymerase sigma factor (sigma-70 family)